MVKGSKSLTRERPDLREALKEAVYAHTRFRGKRPLWAASSMMQSDDDNVITADVNRSVSSWDIHRGIKRSQRNARRRKLGEIIRTLARSLGGFRYYQGLHDICLVFLELTDGNLNDCVELLIPFIRTHFWSLIVTDFDRGLLPLIDRIKFIVQSEDPELHTKLEHSGVGYFISVPWILTWFAHSLHSFSSICDMYNFLLRHDGERTIVYVSASVLLQSRDRLVRENVSHDVVNELDMREVIGFSLDLRRKFYVSGQSKLWRCISRAFVTSMIVLVGLVVSLSLKPADGL